MDQLKLHQNADFGADKDTWLFLQSQSQLLQRLTALAGDKCIISGLEKRLDGTLSAGYIVYQGELLPFKAGEKKERCCIKQDVRTAPYRIDQDGDASYDRYDTYFSRYVAFGQDSDTTFAFAELKRFRTLVELQQALTPLGGIIMWSGKLSDIPAGWFLCDGQHRTPDLRGRFIVGACADELGADADQVVNTAENATYEQGEQGGQAATKLEVENLPQHSHEANADQNGEHSHSYQDSFYLESRDAPSGFQSLSISAIYGPANHDSDNNRIWYKNRATANAGSHTHTIKIGNTGAGKPYENRPPYYALAYIMYLGLSQATATESGKKQA